MASGRNGKNKVYKFYEYFPMKKSLLVTGGGGFVGGNFVRLALKERPEWTICIVDKMEGKVIASSLEGLKEKYKEQIEIEKIDLNEKKLSDLFEEKNFDYVLHFAAKNPSGKEMGDPYQFAEINIERTVRLLEEVRKVSQRKKIRFVHLSSYEVYGTMMAEGFTETSPLKPTTPYAASKAGADLFVFAYNKTFGIDVISTRTTNIYGPYQSDDKFIPMIIKKTISGEEINIFGDGTIVRDWIYVDDHNRAVLNLLEKGRSGEVYHIGANNPKSQNEVIEEVLKNISSYLHKDLRELKKYVKYEKGRIAEDKIRTLKSDKIKKEISFVPQISFKEGIKRTVEFYLKGLWR